MDREGENGRSGIEINGRLIVISVWVWVGGRIRRRREWEKARGYPGYF
jgi:hypothetical protein